MTNLVFTKNKQAVTSSRMIAKSFNKSHKHVLESIDNLQEGVAEKWADLFYETTYIHPQNKQEYREYLMNRDGFTLSAMGFTGKKALAWKLKYIKAFNEMEQTLKKQKKLSPMERLRLQYEVLDNHETRLENLENNMTIDYRQQKILENKIKSKVVGYLGGIGSPAYKDNSVRGKMFSRAWNNLKDYFMVASYRDTPKKDFDKALEIVEKWRPDGKLLREIEMLNSQLEI